MMWEQAPRKQLSSERAGRFTESVIRDMTRQAHVVKDIGVAPVPGSSFYSDQRKGAQQVRFAFCKRDATLDEAAQRLRKLKSD
ncbi:MAG: hypothetical protein ACE14L_00020 [Terriglobales bacterium]